MTVKYRTNRLWGLTKEWYCEKTSHDWNIKEYKRNCKRCGMRGSIMFDRRSLGTLWTNYSKWNWF